MKFKSALLTQASGSVGGMTFATGIGGMIIRSRAIPVNPNSSAQNGVRSSWGALSNWWYTIGTGPRLQWNTYAAQVPLPDTFGDPRLVSGFNHFMRSNANRLNFSGVASVVGPGPTIFNIGMTPILVSCTCQVEVAGTLTVSLIVNIPDAPPGADVDDHIYVFVSPPFNASKSFYRGPFIHGLTEDVAAAGAQPQTLVPVSPHAWDPAGGQSVMFRLHQSQSDGRQSADLFVRCETTAAP